MTNPSPHIPHYAAPPPQRRFPLWDYITYFALTAFCVGVPAMPMEVSSGIQKMYVDLKMKLNVSTQLLLDFYDVLNMIGARYWVWVIPILLPFAIIRLDRDIRFRVSAFMLICSGLITVGVGVAVWLPMVRLMQSVS